MSFNSCLNFYEIKCYSPNFCIIYIQPILPRTSNDKYIFYRTWFPFKPIIHYISFNIHNYIRFREYVSHFSIIKCIPTIVITNSIPVIVIHDFCKSLIINIGKSKNTFIHQSLWKQVSSLSCITERKIVWSNVCKSLLNMSRSIRILPSYPFLAGLTPHHLQLSNRKWQLHKHSSAP